MKTIIIICIILISASGLKAQSTKIKTSFWVSGSCEMCKSNIEGALDKKGVRSAIWNQKTKMVTVVYDSTKVSTQQMYEWVNGVGYETETTPANDSAFSVLPACCKYERKLKAIKE